MDRRQAASWLSRERFQPYLDAANQDHAAAVALYHWHAELAASCFQLIHYFEILVRNSIDAVLGAGQPQEPLRDTWLLDFSVLHPNGIKQVIVAVERLEKGKAVTRSRVIAGVSFGFWAGLFSKYYEDLWRQKLRGAFSAGAGLTRKSLTEPMLQVQKFRNRVAHHDCLLAQPVTTRVTTMLEIAGWIEPDARAWMLRHVDVAAVLARRP